MFPFYENQLEFIRWLHQLSNPWVDAFFKCLDFLVREEFFFILIPAIWVGYYWKSGLRIFYILMLNGITNDVLKELFMEPRPFHVDPTLGIIQVSGYGFPSGAAQTVILLSGILLNYYRNKWIWILCINYVFWISLSRAYLGVHIPTDILGGWVVGSLLWVLYTYVRPSLEKWLDKRSLPMLFLISQVVPLLLLGLSPSPTRLCAVTFTIGAGLCLSRYWKILLNYPKSRRELIIRSIVGIFGTFFLASLDKLLPIDKDFWNTFLQSILIGLWLSLGANFLFYKR